MKKLHTSTKIFFKDPYVLRLDYGTEYTQEQAQQHYAKLCRSAYRLLKGTWGYSPLELEYAQVKNEFGHRYPPGPRHFEGLTHNQMIASLMDPDWVNVPRGYFCFKDEADALQFRLSLAVSAIHVTMWPSRLFTIHEYIEQE